MPWPILLLVAFAVVFVIWTMLSKAGVGTKGGKPDCGCGSGQACSAHSQKEPN